MLFWPMKSARMIVIVGEALLCNDVKIIITLKFDVIKGTSDAQEEHCQICEDVMKCSKCFIAPCRPDGEKKAYVRLAPDYDALDVANKVNL